jgi:hypothetical protein
VENQPIRVGKLFYLSYTILDIAYAVSIISQFIHTPNKEYLEAVMRILRYLKNPWKRYTFQKE